MVLSEVAKLDASQALAAADMERYFVTQYANDPAGAIEAMTSFVENNGMTVFVAWRNFWMFLFSTFRDGGLFTPSTAQQCAPPAFVTNCTAKLQVRAVRVI